MAFSPDFLRGQGSLRALINQSCGKISAHGEPHLTDRGRESTPAVHYVEHTALATEPTAVAWRNGLTRP